MGAVYLCPPPVLKASSGSCMQTMFLDQTFSGSHEHEKEDEEIAKPMDQVSGMFGLLLQRWHMQEQKLKQFTYTLASYQKTDAICPLENLNDDLESDVLVELEEGENRSLRNNESQDLEVTTGKLLHCSNYGKIPIQNADANEEKIEVQGRGHLKKLVSLEEKVETQRKRHLKNCASNNDEMRSAEDMADNTYKRQFQKQSIDDQGCPTQDLPKHDTLIGLNKERRDLVRSFRKLDLARIKRKELLWCRSMEETNKQLRMLATRQQRKKQYLETEQLNALQALEEEKEARLWMINLERLEEEKDLQYFGDLARRDLNMYLIKARTTEVCGTVNQLDLSSSPPISQLESKQKLLEGVKEIRSFTHHVSFNITSEYEYSDDQPSSQKFKNLSVLQEPVEDALPGHNIKEVLSVVHSLQKRQAETHETMGKEMPCEEYFSEDYVSHDCRKKTLHFQVNKVEVSTYRCYAHIPFTFVEKQKLKTGVQQGIFPHLMQVLVSVFLDMTRSGIPQKTLNALEVIPNHSGVCLCIMKFDQPGSTSGDQSNIPTFHCCSTNGKMRSSPHTGDAQFQSYGRILDSICTWISQMMLPLLPSMQVSYKLPNLQILLNFVYSTRSIWNSPKKRNDGPHFLLLPPYVRLSTSVKDSKRYIHNNLITSMDTLCCGTHQDSFNSTTNEGINIPVVSTTCSCPQKVVQSPKVVLTEHDSNVKENGNSLQETYYFHKDENFYGSGMVEKPFTSPRSFQKQKQPGGSIHLQNRSTKKIRAFVDDKEQSGIRKDRTLIAAKPEKKLSNGLHQERKMQEKMDNIILKLQAAWRGYKIRLKFKKAITTSKYVDGDDAFDYSGQEGGDIVLDSARIHKSIQDLDFRDNNEKENDSHIHSKCHNDTSNNCWTNDPSLFVDEETKGMNTNTNLLSNEYSSETRKTEKNTQDSCVFQASSSEDRSDAVKERGRAYMAEIANDWGFKDEKTIKLFLKATRRKKGHKARYPQGKEHHHEEKQGKEKGCHSKTTSPRTTK